MHFIGFSHTQYIYISDSLCVNTSAYVDVVCHAKKRSKPSQGMPDGWMDFWMWIWGWRGARGVREGTTVSGISREYFEHDAVWCVRKRAHFFRTHSYQINVYNRFLQNEAPSRRSSASSHQHQHHRIAQQKKNTHTNEQKNTIHTKHQSTLTHCIAYCWSDVYRKRRRRRRWYERRNKPALCTAESEVRGAEILAVKNHKHIYIYIYKMHCVCSFMLGIGLSSALFACASLDSSNEFLHTKIKKIRIELGLEGVGKGMRNRRRLRCWPIAVDIIYIYIYIKHVANGWYGLYRGDRDVRLSGWWGQPNMHWNHDALSKWRVINMLYWFCVIFYIGEVGDCSIISTWGESLMHWGRREVEMRMRCVVQLSNCMKSTFLFLGKKKNAHISKYMLFNTYIYRNTYYLIK